VTDLPLGGIDWVIVGGESGPGARPMEEGWALDIVDQCRELAIPCFVKQMGAAWAREHGGPLKGNDPALWNPLLRVREMPSASR
jgi:protein gp37